MTDNKSQWSSLINQQARMVCSGINSTQLAAQIVPRMQEELRGAKHDSSVTVAMIESWFNGEAVPETWPQHDAFMRALGLPYTLRWRLIDSLPNICLLQKSEISSMECKVKARDKIELLFAPLCKTPQTMGVRDISLDVHNRKPKSQPEPVVWQFLERWRSKRNLSSQEFETRYGISYAAMSSYKRGAILPSKALLAELEKRCTTLEDKSDFTELETLVIKARLEIIRDHEEAMSRTGQSRQLSIASNLSELPPKYWLACVCRFLEQQLPEDIAQSEWLGDLLPITKAGEYLKAMRGAFSLSVAEVSEATGVHMQSINAIELGRSNNRELIMELGKYYRAKQLELGSTRDAGTPTIYHEQKWQALTSHLLPQQLGKRPRIRITNNTESFISV